MAGEMGIVVQIALVTCTCIVDVRAKFFVFFNQVEEFYGKPQFCCLETYRFLLNDLDDLEI